MNVYKTDDSIVFSKLPFYSSLIQLLMFLNGSIFSIPFSVDDISKSMEQIDIADIESPLPLRENSGFSFLLPRTN